jgi:hypothetical protein
MRSMGGRTATIGTFAYRGAPQKWRKSSFSVPEARSCHTLLPLVDSADAELLGDDESGANIG